MAYVSQELKAKLAPQIRAVCKKHGVKGSLSVRNHSTLVLTIKSAKHNLLDDYVSTCRPDKYHQVNVYWVDTYFKGKTKDFLIEVLAAMKGPDWYDRSDSQTDYFDTSHYYSIDIGKWNRPLL